MKHIKHIFAKWSKTEKKEAVKKVPYAADQWMHEQVKWVLKQNYQQFVTSK